MIELTYEQRVLKIAKEIMSIRPGVHPKSALREAKAIARTRDTYRVSAEQKHVSCKRLDFKELPEYVKLTIKKQKKAEVERIKTGRKLPTLKFLSGGGVSPR